MTVPRKGTFSTLKLRDKAVSRPKELVDQRISVSVRKRDIVALLEFTEQRAGDHSEGGARVRARGAKKNSPSLK